MEQKYLYMYAYEVKIALLCKYTLHMYIVPLLKRR
jgi:hypothetical protein